MASKSFKYFLSSISSVVDVSSAVTNIVKYVESSPYPVAVETKQLNLWTAAPNMLTARAGGGAGTQNAGLAIAGSNGSAGILACEKFNLTAWSATGSTLVEHMNGCGTQNAAMSAAGMFSWHNDVSTFNGTAWSISANPLVISDAQGFFSETSGRALVGTQSAALVAGGYGYSIFADNEGYVPYGEKGGALTPWVVTSNLLLNARGTGMIGVQNSALLIGGQADAFAVYSQSYNGTVWSAGPNMNVSRYQSGATGVRNKGIVYGGYSGAGAPASASSEKFDGTTFSVTTSMLQARGATYGASGTANTLHVHGGASGVVFASTEMFTGEAQVTPVAPKFYLQGLTAKTDVSGRRFIPAANEVLTVDSGYATGVAASNTVLSGQEFTDLTALGRIESVSAKGVGSVWQAGPNMTVSRWHTHGAGTFNAPIICNGVYTPNPAIAMATADRFVGAAWAQVQVSSQGKYFAGAVGLQNALLTFGGLNTSGVAISTTDYFNGTTVAVRTALPVNSIAFGSGSHAFSVLASTSVQVGVTGTYSFYKYDGTSWSTTTASPFLVEPCLTGAQASTIAAKTSGTQAVKFNGTTWSATGSLLLPQHTFVGTQNSCLAMSNTAHGSTQIFNGTTWIAAPATLQRIVDQDGGAGTPGGALRAGGRDGANAINIVATERFLSATPASYSRWLQFAVEASSVKQI